MTVRPAGKYIKTLHGADAFIPDPLPPRSDIWKTNKIISLMSKADRHIGMLDGMARMLPSPDLMIMMFIKKEAVLSSQIEGTQASLVNVLQFEADALDPNGPKDASDVVNYIGAMEIGMKTVRDGKAVDLDLVLQMHKRLMVDVRGGQFEPGKIRTVQNWVGPPGTKIGDAVFVPPPSQQVEGLLEDLLEPTKDGVEVPPFIRAAMVHYQFETIHPFLDGNGRIGRLLIPLGLMKWGHLDSPLLYLSHHFRKNQFEYYELLQRVRTNSEWERWFDFFLRGVISVSMVASQMSLDVLQLKKRTQDRIRKDAGGRLNNALILVDHLFIHPIVNVKAVSEATNLSYPNANGLASMFEDIGILKEVTGQKRNRVWEFSDYLDLLDA